jgi:hypothetical protein
MACKRGILPVIFPLDFEPSFEYSKVATNMSKVY